MSYNFSIRSYTEARKVEKSAAPQSHTAFPHRIGGIGAIIGDKGAQAIASAIFLTRGG